MFSSFLSANEKLLGLNIGCLRNWVTVRYGESSFVGLVSWKALYQDLEVQIRWKSVILANFDKIWPRFDKLKVIEYVSVAKPYIYWFVYMLSI